MPPSRSDQGTALEPGLIARAAGKVGQAIAGVTQAWFGPLEPLQTLATPDPRGRVLDYPAGYNITGQQRWPEQADFSALRNLARNCDLVTLAMETRKDQLDAIEWTFTTRDEKTKITPDIKKRIDELNAAFAFPDKKLTLNRWIRKGTDDILAIDALSIYMEPNRGGTPYRLKIIDGATIKPLIDANGDTPQFPNVAYQQWLKGVPAVDFTTKDLTYNPRNPRPDKFYGYSPVEQIYVTINIAIRKQLLTLAGYTEGTVPEAIVPVPEGWGTAQIAEFQVYWDAVLSGNLGQQRHMRFVPAGIDKAIFPKKFDDKDEYTDYLVRVVAYAFGLPPTWGIRQGTKGNVEQESTTGKEEGLTPIVNYWRETLTLLIWKYWNYYDLVAMPKNKGLVDPLAQAQADEIRTRAGHLHINEVREGLGRDPIPNMPATVQGGALINISEGIPSAEQKAEEDRLAAEAGGFGGKKPDDEETKKKKEEVEKLLKAAKKKVKMLPVQGAARIQKHLTTAITKLFKKLATKYANRLAQGAATSEKAAGPVDPDDIDFDEFDVLVTVVEPQISSVAKRSSYTALAQLEIKEEGITNSVETRAISYAKKRSAELVGKRWVNGELVNNPNAKWAITDSTRDMLKQTIASGVENQLSTDALAESIEKSYAFSEARAETIARTEIAKAHTEGNYAAWQESGAVVGKAWILSSEHDLDDVCNGNADDGVIGLDEAFSSGDMMPPAHPNCECGWYAVTKAGAAEMEDQ